MLGYTLNASIVSPVPFFAARLRIHGAASSAVVGVTAGVAPTTNFGGGVGANTEAAVPLKVSGASSWTVPAALSGGGTNDEEFSTVVTDWSIVQSVARTDGGKGYLLNLRVYQPSAGNTSANRVTPLGTTAADVDLYGAAAIALAGDQTAAYANFTGAITSFGPAASVELLSPSGAITVGVWGDSTTAGTDSYKNNAGGLTLSAISLLGAGIPIGYHNAGETVSQSSTYLKNLKNAFASGLRPSVAVFCGFSPNDGDKYTAAGTARQIAGMLEFVSVCRDYGVVPVVMTPCPVTGLNSTQEGERRKVVSATKQVAAAFGIKLLDRDALYTDYSTASGGWLPGMNFNSVHPSPASYALEAATLWAPLAQSFA